MNKQKKYALLAAIILFFVSCGNQNAADQPEKESTISQQKVRRVHTVQIDSGLYLQYELFQDLPDEVGCDTVVRVYHRTYGQLWGTIIVRDTMGSGEDTNAYARSFCQLVYFNMAKPDMREQPTFLSVVAHECTHLSAPRHHRPVDSFPLSFNQGEVVVETHGLKFCLTNGKRIDILEEALAEVAPVPLFNGKYVRKSYANHRVGELLATCLNKHWLRMSDCFLALNTNKPEIVISKLTNTPPGKLYPEYSKIVIGIFQRAANAPGDDWKKEVGELEYYRTHRMLRTPFK